MTKRPEQKYYVTFLIQVHGKLYRVNVVQTDDEEISLTWVSTPVGESITDIRRLIDAAMERINFLLEERPGRIRRVQVTVFEYYRRPNVSEALTGTET